MCEAINIDWETNIMNENDLSDKTNNKSGVTNETLHPTYYLRVERHL